MPHSRLFDEYRTNILLGMYDNLEHALDRVDNSRTHGGLGYEEWVELRKLAKDFFAKKDDPASRTCAGIKSEILRNVYPTSDKAIIAIGAALEYNYITLDEAEDLKRLARNYLPKTEEAMPKEKTTYENLHHSIRYKSLTFLCAEERDEKRIDSLQLEVDNARRDEKISAQERDRLFRLIDICFDRAEEKPKLSEKDQKEVKETIQLLKSWRERGSHQTADMIGHILRAKGHEIQAQGTFFDMADCDGFGWPPPRPRFMRDRPSGKMFHEAAELLEKLDGYGLANLLTEYEGAEYALRGYKNTEATLRERLNQRRERNEAEAKELKELRELKKSLIKAHVIKDDKKNGTSEMYKHLSNALTRENYTTRKSARAAIRRERNRISITEDEADKLYKLVDGRFKSARAS